MVPPWYVKITKFAENSPLLARNCAQNRKLPSLTRVAPQDMTRRDGLSSWRVILFVAAGMSSGKSTANYVYFCGRKSRISNERTNSFSPGIFFRLPLMLQFCACKTSARSIGYRKSLSELKVLHGCTRGTPDDEIS